MAGRKKALLEVLADEGVQEPPGSPQAGWVSMGGVVRLVWGWNTASWGTLAWPVRYLCQLRVGAVVVKLLEEGRVEMVEGHCALPAGECAPGTIHPYLRACERKPHNLAPGDRTVLRRGGVPPMRG